MVTNEFAEASAELIEILKYIPKTEVEKIPLKLRGFFEDVSKPNYNVRIDPRKPLEEQDLKEKTKDLITVIYRNYWCTEEEKRILDKQLLENDKKYEEELRKKYYKRKVKGDLYEEIHKNHTCNFNYNHDSNMHNVCN